MQKNVWVEFVGLAMKHNAVNLGQGTQIWLFSRFLRLSLGFPNFPPIDHVMKGLSAIPVENHLNNQYTRGFGHVPLIQALADFYGPLFNRKMDINEEILITVGAYYSLYAATQG